MHCCTRIASHLCIPTSAAVAAYCSHSDTRLSNCTGADDKCAPTSRSANRPHIAGVGCTHEDCTLS